ncbi:RNA polymerase sigma factor [Spirochaeta isovalerica]|uniref:RNA polymerase sigma-70 factor (ECF subfamily) n=1 Tax=Spirochaeta isovalerica TaxID=150 RepID=A0A841R4J5_9SPIO|nr:sigma-70 family RNA polymerase sigma factor [Spirochaeta isovalerica]MBB6478785.1 RNA polymerase sigma-70 factor (ECF subfamily) [Spirochaeta isovalerica]
MAIDVEDFYRKYGPMVLRRCRSILKNEDAAMDAMQDVFVKILKKEKELNNSSPSSLLYITATNVCLNILRKSERKAEASDNSILDIIAGSDDPEERVLNNIFLDKLFKKEKPSTRTIAMLHYVDGFTLEETAEQVGMSVSGIRKRLRGLRKNGLELREV